MISRKLVLLSALWQVSQCMDLTFPSDFKFGAATASYQIEGGWNADGKGEHVWDRLAHQPGKIQNNETGDVAANSYEKWRDDIRVAKEMGLQFYRFSISWPRILPTGFPNEFNTVGAKYYSDLIDGLLEAGIEPVVTLYHWELPVKMQDMGGWTNPLIVNWFGNYARVVYSLYADRVSRWLTINEANVVCDIAYNVGAYAPAVKEPMFAPYICNKHVMLAHAKAYRIYDEEFKHRYKGKVSLANNLMWIEPSTPEDMELAELAREFMGGRYSHPILTKEGGWPPSLEKLMWEVSREQGHKESRLPAFTEKEKEFIRGTADFYGINYYTTNMIRAAKPGEDAGQWFISGSPELSGVLEQPPNVYYGALRGLPVYPEGLRRQLAWLKKQYGDVDIMITENGYSTIGYQLNDYERSEFFREHLEQILLSVKVDNVSVNAFAAWSLIDNFEWLQGYNVKFGLYEVDFEDPDLTRRPRASAHFYACVINNRSLMDTCLDQNYIVGRSKQTRSKNGAQVVTNIGILLSMSLVLSYIIR